MKKTLKELREDKDLNQFDLAKILNISQSTYSRYESGYLNIPNDIMIKLSEFYAVSVDYILGLTDEYDRPKR